MKETRILALDVGERRIGVAITEWGGVVIPLAVIPTRATPLESIRQLVEERDIEKVVVGLPISLNDSLGPQAAKVKAFVDELATVISIPIELVDERFTSVEAEEKLLRLDTSRRKRRAVLDQHAAAEILTAYLRSRG